MWNCTFRIKRRVYEKIERNQQAEQQQGKDNQELWQQKHQKLQVRAGANVHIQTDVHL
jgi:hypothetical protein